MAARRVSVRLSLISILSAFILHLSKATVLQKQVKRPDSLAALSFEHRVVQERRVHRTKSSLVKLTKHGAVVIQLQETSNITRFVGQETILRSGDVHPQPAPNAKDHRAGPTENAGRITYSSIQLINFAKAKNSSPIASSLKLHLQNLGVWNTTCTDYSRIFPIPTFRKPHTSLWNGMGELWASRNLLPP